MVAEAQRAPRVVHDRMIAFATHPRVAVDDPKRALERLLHRVERFRAAYEAADQYLSEAQASDSCPPEVVQAHLLVMLGNEHLTDALVAIDAIHNALPTSAAA